VYALLISPACASWRNADARDPVPAQISLMRSGSPALGPSLCSQPRQQQLHHGWPFLAFVPGRLARIRVRATHTRWNVAPQPLQRTILPCASLALAAPAFADEPGVGPAALRRHEEPSATIAFL
jgi:hypothetical protein